MKQLAMSLVRATPLTNETKEKVLFLGKMGYWPDFENPKTYNEKINWRKLRSTNERFIQCADKFAVREYVREKIGEQYLIPLLYHGTSITPETLQSLGNDIAIKANHDSGSTQIIRENTMEASTAACHEIEKSLSTNYGERTNEWWYARIAPRACVEKLILDDEGKPACDFKFFVFRQPGDSNPKIFIEVDYDRNTPHHHRGFYTADRQPVDSFGQDIVIDDVPNLRRPFPEVANYPEMLRLVKILAEDFDHVRVDLYSTGKEIYFGELTFSEGGGRSRWNPRGFDKLLGDCWDLDRSVGGSECPVEPEQRVKQEFRRPDALKRFYQSSKESGVEFLKRCAVSGDRVLRFFALPYAVRKWVDWEQCDRNPILVFADHLYIFFALGYFPDNYTACRLWEKPRSEWKNYYGRGYDPKAVHLRNQKVRRPECAVLFEDKEICHQLCHSWNFPLPRQLAVIDPSVDFASEMQRLMEKSEARRLFVKPIDGDGGRGSCLVEFEGSTLVVRQIAFPEEVIPVSAFTLSRRSVVQEAIVQHPTLSLLFPGALNTVRIATLFTPAEDVKVVGAFLRIGKGSQFVDNGDQGGIGAAIDLSKGRLADVASNNRGKKFERHPDTGFSFGEMTLPDWGKVISLASDVQSRFAPFNRFLGMDIGFSESGPILVEVNDIFDCGRFESVVGPIFKDPEVLRIAQHYGLITHGRHR